MLNETFDQLDLNKYSLYLDLLTNGLVELKINLDLKIQQKLLMHLFMVQKWNKIHNLTRITSLKDMIIKHTLDSLTIWEFLKGKVFLDLGSGAGFPGIPLALVCLNKHFYLADKSHKKQIFLAHVKNNLQIANVVAIVADVGQFKPFPPLDGILTRAFGPLDIILQNVSPLLQKNCKLYVMLGDKINKVNLDKTIFRHNIIPLKLPTSNFKRNLLLIEKI